MRSMYVYCVFTSITALFFRSRFSFCLFTFTWHMHGWQSETPFNDCKTLIKIFVDSKRIFTVQVLASFFSFVADFLFLSRAIAYTRMQRISLSLFASLCFFIFFYLLWKRVIFRFVVGVLSKKYCSLFNVQCLRVFVYLLTQFFPVATHSLARSFFHFP